MEESHPRNTNKGNCDELISVKTSSKINLVVSSTNTSSSSHSTTSKGSNTLRNRISRLFRRSPTSNQTTTIGSLDVITTPMTSQTHLNPVPLTRANAYTPPDSQEHESSKRQLSDEVSSQGPNLQLVSTGSVTNIDVTELPEYFVYTWGDNTHGQLLSQEDHYKPYRIERLSHRCITYLNCGTMSTWLISDSGDVYAGGQNTKGQISSSTSEDVDIRQPRHLEEFESMRVKSVAAAEEHTVVVLESGVAISYGSNEFGQLGHGKGTETLGRVHPKRMIGLKVPVSQACCGTCHTLILSTTGQVFSCGNGADGCLGLGDDALEMTSILQPLPKLIGIPIQQIATGPEHSMALSLSGNLFSWGRNRKGRLGIGPDLRTIIATPICLNSGNLPPFKQIATGLTHSAAIGTRGRIYFCGDNSEGQLGLNPEHISFQDTFRPLEFDKKMKIRVVACGDRHTVIINNIGEVFCFGLNDRGQSGQGTSQIVWHPSSVGFWEDSQNRTNDLYFYAISAGRDHTAAVAVSFPPGICRQNSVIVSTPIPGSESSFVSDPSTPVFQSSISRLGSKLALLRQKSRPQLSKLDGHFSVLSDNTLSAEKQIPTLFHLPSILASNPTRPSLHLFQTLRSVNSMDQLMLGSSIEAASLSKKTRTFAQVPTIDAVHSDDAEAHLPAGCAVSEILSLVESTRNSADPEAQMRFLKRRLASVYSDPHRLNCSFLLPGRLPLLDAEGVEEVFDEIDKLQQEDKDAIYSSLYTSASDLLAFIEPYAAHFVHSDQVRCIALILQLRFLSNPIASNLRLLGRFSSLVFRFPEAGRRCLVDLFKTQYSASIFGQRPVAHIRAFLNVTIKSQAGTSPSVWHGIVLFQLMFLSSMEWAVEQRTRAIENAGRAQIVGKIPVENFILESINEDVDIAEELRCFKKFGHPLETAQLTSGPRVNVVTVTRAQIPTSLPFIGSSLRVHTAPSTRPSEIPGDGTGREHSAVSNTQEDVAQSPISHQSVEPHLITSTVSEQPVLQQAFSLNTNLGAGCLQMPSVGEKSKIIQAEKLPEAEKKSELSPTTLITGRPPAIFDPSKALKVSELHESWNFFLAHQNICPLKFKRNVIMIEALVNQQRSSMHSMFLQGHPFFFMPVRRNNVVEEALNVVLCSPPDDMLKPLKVIFDGEEGVDAGGLKREFFNIIVGTLFDPQYGMFVYNPEPRTVWFNRNTIDTDNEFFLVGVILGLALYNDNLLNLRFPMVVWKKLQDQPVGIEDLVDVFPTEGESFMKILEWPSDKKDEFDAAFGTMTFVVQYDFFGEIKSVELSPGGMDITLTYINRKEYVDLYVDYLLNSSIKTQFEAFKRGFLHFQTTLLKTLSAEELHLLVCGTTTLDFVELREGTKYEGFNDDDLYIQGFWETLNSLDIYQKKKFLRFCTGTDRVPLGGLKELQLKIQRNGCEPTERLPTAYTCFNLLLLPEYSSNEKLQRLLVLAIEQFQGFGLQ